MPYNPRAVIPTSRTEVSMMYVSSNHSYVENLTGVHAQLLIPCWDNSLLIV